MVGRPVSVVAGLDSATIGRLMRTPSVGLGTRWTVLKAAFAGSASYAIAASVGPDRYAALAPVVAVFTVQGSVLGTLAQGLQRVLGTVLGVAAAVVFVQWVGTTWWSIGTALLVALLVARRLPIGFAGQAQIPISILLTLALGPSQTGYGQWRVVDSLIGGVVGIAVGVLVPERPPFAAAERAQAAWSDALHTQLTRIADELEQPTGELVGRQRHAFIATSSALVEVATAGRRATALAQDGVAFNPWGRGHHEQLARLRAQESELVRVTLEIRVLSLTVDQLYDRPHHAPFLDRGTLAGLLRGCADLDQAHRAGRDVTAESAALRAQIAQAVAGVTQQQTDAYAVLDSVSLLGRLDQLPRDISGRHPAEPGRHPTSTTGTTTPVARLLAGGRLDGAAAASPEVLAQRARLALVAGRDVGAVEPLRRSCHVLEAQLADALPVLDDEGHVVRSDLERGAAPGWSASSRPRIRDRRTPLVRPQLAAGRVVGDHLACEVGRDPYPFRDMSR